MLLCNVFSVILFWEMDIGDLTAEVKNIMK